MSLCGGHSLARISDDPVLKQRYQELALVRAYRGRGERAYGLLDPVLRVEIATPSIFLSSV